MTQAALTGQAYAASPLNFDSAHWHVQVIKRGQTSFPVNLLDDLLGYLKSLQDSDCKYMGTSYLDYMEKTYEFQQLPGSQVQTGIHNFDKSFIAEVLKPYTTALIDMLSGIPYAVSAKSKSSSTREDFKAVLFGMLTLDQPEWRPVALLAMRKTGLSKEHCKVCFATVCICDILDCMVRKICHNLWHGCATSIT